jgi:RNA polymerase sigma factor (sigma-70 family)
VKGFRLRRQPATGVGPLRPQALDLAQVYDEHADAVYRWVSRLGGQRLEAEDLMHEVFLVVRDRLPSFRGEAKLTTWLYRIAANVVRDRRRRERRFQLRNQACSAEARFAAPVLTPVEDLERRRDIDLVYRVLDTMNERYRTVLILFEIEGLPGEEVAELLGQKLDTVWVLLHRARRQFRERLGQLEPGYAERKSS